MLNKHIFTCTLCLHGINRYININILLLCYIYDDIMLLCWSLQHILLICYMVVMKQLCAHVAMLLLCVHFVARLLSFAHFVAMLQLRDGGTMTSPLVGSYCGSTIPPVYVSTTNQLHIEFHSDWSSTGQGFLLNWEATTDQSITTPAPTSATPPGKWY